MAALEELVKTVDGSKYSVHASSILESHDVTEPVSAVSAAGASSKVRHYMLPGCYSVLLPSLRNRF